MAETNVILTVALVAAVGIGGYFLYEYEKTKMTAQAACNGKTSGIVKIPDPSDATKTVQVDCATGSVTPFTPSKQTGSAELDAAARAAKLACKDTFSGKTTLACRRAQAALRAIQGLPAGADTHATVNGKAPPTRIQVAGADDPNLSRQLRSKCAYAGTPTYTVGIGSKKYTMDCKTGVVTHT